ncbi:MAG: ParA family protein [Acidobacteriota bacterium]
MRYVIFNRKGGVGKSTLVVNLAAVAAQRGYRTLVVDLDSQANATQYLLGRAAAEAKPTVADYFDSTLGFQLLKAAAGDHVHPTPFENLDLLPAADALADLESKLASKHKIYKLKSLLQSLEREGYERIFLDTPPAVNFYTLSALIAAERCLIPFDCDEFSRRAVYQLLGIVREVREDHNSDLTIGGILVNNFQERARLPQTLVDELRAESLPVLEPYLTNSVKVRESHRDHTPLIHLAPGHKLSLRLEELFDSVEAAEGIS